MQGCLAAYSDSEESEAAAPMHSKAVPDGLGDSEEERAGGVPPFSFSCTQEFKKHSREVAKQSTH